MAKIRKLAGRAVLVAAALMALAGPASAAGAAADGGEVLRLYPGVAPGSETAHQVEVADGPFVRNVTTPTLTVFRPRPGTATDTAVIVVPGGAFEMLSMSNEGYEVARRLAEHGITAVVLKYRLNETPALGPLAFARIAMLLARMNATPLPDRLDERYASPGAKLAIQDGDAALRFVRAHASAWAIAPNRVGMLGFSAGAMLTMSLAVSPEAGRRPDFVGAIYGAMPRAATAPAGAPPIFLAVAADDKLVGPGGSLPIFDAWRAGGHDAELHIYQSGGHGFGTDIHHRTSDHWIDAYLWWLEARGLAPAR